MQKRISSDKPKKNKTGVINDPIGQLTVPAGSDCRLILKFWDGRTLCVKIVITTTGTVVGLVDQQNRESSAVIP